MTSDSLSAFLEPFRDRSAVLGIIGLGYVGLPLANAAAKAGFRVIGFDVDAIRAAQVTAGRSPIPAVPDTELREAVEQGRMCFTSNFDRLGEVDACIICVPTPITAQREPDLSHVVAASEAIARTLRPGQLVALESTTWPGTTVEVIRPILERGGLKSGRDFFLAYSPEREDPGNARFGTHDIPKVVGGDGAEALEAARLLYSAVVSHVVPVSSTQTAEAVKLTENIFRAVNIALVNELKVVFHEMDIDVWEVIEAAKSKPFGFMPFYPGPGLGGHCIPIDPFYLTWKAREFDQTTRFIELAGQINVAMPRYVLGRLMDEMNRRFSRGLNGARILLVGMAYKRGVSDVRESPAFKLMTLLEEQGAVIDYHDPHVPEIHQGHGCPRDAVGVALEDLHRFDAAIIVTDHEEIDYPTLLEGVPLVLDTRNVCERKGLRSEVLAKA